MSGESDFLPLRLVTDELPEKDRLAIFVEEFSRTVLNSNFEPVPDARFFHSATLRKLPGLAMMAGEGSGGHVSRTRSHIADGRDDFVLQIALAGAGETSQLGCQISAAPGEAVLMSSQEVSTTYMPSTTRYVTIAIPRQALAHRLPDPEASLMRLIPAGNEALRLLMGYLTLLNGGDVSLNGAALEIHVRLPYLRFVRSCFEAHAGHFRAGSRWHQGCAPPCNQAGYPRSSWRCRAHPERRGRAAGRQSPLCSDAVQARGHYLL